MSFDANILKTYRRAKKLASELRMRIIDDDLSFHLAPIEKSYAEDLFGYVGSSYRFDSISEVETFLLGMLSMQQSIQKIYGITMDNLVDKLQEEEIIQLLRQAK